CSIASSADGTRLVAAAGHEKQIYTSADSGLTWVSNNIPFLPTFWQCVAMSADGRVLGVVGVGTNNTFYMSTNSAASWFPVLSLKNAWWISIGMSADGSKLIVLGTEPEFIVTSTNFGATWTQQTAAPVPVNPYGWGPSASSADGTKLYAA